LRDAQVPHKDVLKLVEKLQAQKGITIHHDEIDKADHFFQETIPDLMESVNEYLDMRLQPNEE
jgi:alpha/beta superfamily hydrolase